MTCHVDSVWDDLQILIAQLMEDGGAISPSVYDTAQLIRLYPPKEGVGPALRWLQGQQGADGGWGNEALPVIRDVPTLAALLAFNHYRHDFPCEDVVSKGISFLRQRHHLWATIALDDLPVGIELILPKLVSQAQNSGLSIPTRHYGKLTAVREAKLRQIAKLPVRPATPPTFSWEAWGTFPDPCWLDESGGVGHNPAATVQWLVAAENYPELCLHREKAMRYLTRAAQATGLDIPGVVPSAWPIDRFEQIFALHTLLMSGLLFHPRLQSVIGPQIDSLAQAIRPDGIGFSDYFTTDGDNTAAAMAVLQAMRGLTDSGPLEHFCTTEHFWGYIDELQVSHSVTARSIYTLSALGEDTTSAEQFLLKQQLVNGAWPGDKWNISPYYGTCLAAFALQHKPIAYAKPLQAAINFLQRSQLPTGGWSINQQPAMTDTAYALLALHILRACGPVDERIIERGQKWVGDNYRPFFPYNEQRWLNKQEYEPYRIDWSFILAAMLAVIEPVYT